MSEETPAIDIGKVKSFKTRLEMEQNLPLGIVAGVIAALVGAVLWAVVTVLTKTQIGWMAVGVGFLVGYAVRLLGKGITPTFRILGAVFALAGCILGNLFSVCGFVANQESLPVFQVVGRVLAHPALAFHLLKATFSPMDVVFYAFAVYEGYRFSLRRITPQEMAELGSGA